MSTPQMIASKKVENKRDLILGVDPGLKGAFAFYNFEAKAIEKIFDMPHLHVPHTKKDGKIQIDGNALAMTIASYGKRVKFAVIEEVSARPGQGVVSMFSFGFATGLITGVIAAEMIPIISVKAAIWKMLMGLSSDKNLSREKAIKLFPTEKRQFERAKDDGRAEAILLAVFGAERFG